MKCKRIAALMVVCLVVAGAVGAANVNPGDLLVLSNENGSRGVWSYSYNAGTGQYDKSTEQLFIDMTAYSTATDMSYGPDGNLYVVLNSTTVKRYNGTTGAFVEDYITGLIGGKNIAFSPSTGKAYVDNFQGTNYSIPIYERQNDGTLSLFATSPGYNSNYRMTFGPDLNNDGNADLYASTNRWGFGVFRFADGTYYDYANPGSLYEAFCFGPDRTGDGIEEVYGASQYISGLPVREHNGATGALIGDFTGSISAYPGDMVFGPDGKLYIANYVHGDLKVYTGSGVFAYEMYTGGHTWALGQSAYALEFVPTPIPEPGSILALSAGLVGLAGYARRRRK